MTQFEEPAGADTHEATVSGPGEAASEAATASAAPVPGPPSAATPPASPVAAALAELDSLPQRELAEHPETYQRIHAELQSALATIDNA